MPRKKIARRDRNPIPMTPLAQYADERMAPIQLPKNFGANRVNPNVIDNEQLIASLGLSKEIFDKLNARSKHQKQTDLLSFFDKYLDQAHSVAVFMAGEFKAYIDGLHISSGKPAVLPVNLFHLKASLKLLPSGDFIALPWSADRSNQNGFNWDLQHMYAKCVSILKDGSPNSQKVILDSEGFMFGNFFNREDKVTYHIDPVSKEIVVTLTDIKHNPSYFVTKRPEEFKEIIAKRLDNACEVKYVHEVYTALPFSFSDASDELYRTEDMSVVELDVPDECKCAMEMAECFVRNKDKVNKMRAGTRVALDYLKIRQEEIRTKLKATTQANKDADDKLKDILGDAYDVNKHDKRSRYRAGALGTSTPQDEAQILRDIAAIPKMAGYHKVMKETLKHYGSVLHGMPPPRTEAPKYVKGKPYRPLANAIDNKESLCNFFYKVATEWPKKGHFWCISMLTLEARQLPMSEFKVGRFDQTNLFDVCAKIVKGGTHVIRKPGDEPLTYMTENNEKPVKGRTGVMVVGCSDDGPSYLKDWLRRDERMKYGGKKRAEVWDEFVYQGDGSEEAMADWHGKMQKMIGVLGKTQDPAGYSVAQRAYKLANANDDKALGPRLAQQMSDEMLLYMSRTYGCQSLDIEVEGNRMTAVCNTKLAQSATGYFTIHGNGKVAMLTRTTSMINHARGSAQIVWVGSPVEDIGWGYVCRDNPKVHNDDIAVSKAMYKGSKQSRQSSHAVQQVAVFLANHHSNLAQAVHPNDLARFYDFQMAGHMCAAAINPTRNASVSISVGRWLTMILAGLSGDPSAVAKKAQNGVFMTQLDQMVVYEILLRNACASMLRDMGDIKTLHPPSIDMSRALIVNPPYTSNHILFGRPETFANFQGTIDSWYTCEATGTGITGDENSTARGMDLVLKIIKEYDNPVLKRNNAGVGNFAWDTWKSHENDTKDERAAALDAMMDNPDFWASERTWALDLISSPEHQKCKQSILMVVEQGLKAPIDPNVLEAAFRATKEKPVVNALSLKKGMLQLDIEKNIIGRTEYAALAFMVPLVNNVDITEESFMSYMEELKSFESSGVLACCIAALTSGRPGMFTITNKEDSIEKVRCIAIMDWVLRYCALFIEELIEPLLARGSTAGGSKNNETKTSVIKMKDKAVPMKRAAKEMEMIIHDAKHADYKDDNEEVKVEEVKEELTSLRYEDLFDEGVEYIDNDLNVRIIETDEVVGYMQVITTEEEREVFSVQQELLRRTPDLALRTELQRSWADADVKGGKESKWERLPNRPEIKDIEDRQVHEDEELGNFRAFMTDKDERRRAERKVFTDSKFADPDLLDDQGNISVKFRKNTNVKLIKMMNDASAWGPWKNLTGMYAYLIARGFTGTCAVLVKKVIEMFLVKEMVPHHSLLPRAPRAEATEGEREELQIQYARRIGMMRGKYVDRLGKVYKPKPVYWTKRGGGNGVVV